jgi:hypothetical protein
MKILIIQLFTPLLSLLAFKMQAQKIRNAVTDTFTVSGNCDMCKKTIEKAASKKGFVMANWNLHNKQLVVTYNSKKTNPDEILKRVAYAGYDNESYLAPGAAYAELDGCCKYERTALALNQKKESKHEDHSHHESNPPSHQDHKQYPAKQESTQKQNQLEQVYVLYFEVKDALVNDDQKTASSKAKSLFAAFDEVKTEELTTGEHNAFMKDLQDLKTHAEHISKSSDIEHQREHFTSLSKLMFGLMKVIKPSYPVYLDHCPMYNDGKGADWISKETTIKNPYYGSKMQTCGKIKESIK